MTRQYPAAWLAGAIFGAGLVVSGMTSPANIKGFLDVFGDFRPNLAFVMVGAILVHGIALRWPFRTVVPPDGSLPARARVDGALLLGAALFGVGWALGGYCPGPSIVALGAGRLEATIFVAASVVGILCADLLRAAPSLARKGTPRALETIR